jgi:hypothetical protein
MKALPPKQEWDFRGVDDSALEQATIWEYARTSDKVRRFAPQWQRDIAANKPWPDYMPNNALFPLYEVMEERPDFPAPWTANPIRYESNPFFSSVRCTPFPKRTPRVPLSGYHLHITWSGHSTEQIVKDMTRWIREESKKHSTHRPRGKTAQAGVDPLKWLAAYRISKAGLTFPEAQVALEQHANDYRLTPHFKDKSSWSDAIRHAKQKLALLEVGL